MMNETIHFIISFRSGDKHGGNAPPFGSYFRVEIAKDELLNNNFNEPWTVARLGLHEFGHTQGLQHAFCCGNLCSGIDIDPVIENDGINCCSGCCGSACSSCWNNSGNELIMAYGSQVYFTQCELSRIWTNILEFDYPFLTFNECQTTTNQDVIYDNQSVIEWRNKKLFNKDVIIKNGTSIRVFCDVELGDNVKITVEPGADFIVEGTGRITNLCGGFWDGIYATGDPNIGQSGGSIHPKVTVRDGGIIENSENGIQLIDGAIGWFDDATFLNNKRAIEWHDYNFNNFSYISDSEFIIDEGYLDIPNANQIRQVNMSLVRSIDIENNVFFNQLEEKDGIAIISMDGGYTVTSTTGNSIFEGWYIGINAKGDFSPNTFEVYNSTFEECDYGILVEAENNFVVQNNQFNICFGTGPSSTISETGMMTDYCTGYDISFNSFEGFNPGFTSFNNNPVGLIIKDSGNEPNLVDVNDFTYCNYANLSNGDNTEIPFNNMGGLQYLCNTQSDNINDITVPQELGTFGVALFQGSNIAPAGNTFTPGLSGLDYNINNRDYTTTADYMHYFYHPSLSNHNPTNIHGVLKITSLNDPICREAPNFGGDGEPEREESTMPMIENAEEEYLLLLSQADEKDMEQMSEVHSAYHTFYRLINEALASNYQKEERDYELILALLNKKQKVEARIPKIGLFVEQGLYDEAEVEINETIGNINQILSSFSNLKKDNAAWYQATDANMDMVKEIAGGSDAQSTLFAINVDEYYLDGVYPKTIVYPDGEIEIRGKNENPMSEMEILPNPNSGDFTVSFSESKIGKIEIVTVKGLRLYEKAITDIETITFTTFSLQPGIYFVHYLGLDGEMIIKKMIVVQ